MTLDELLRSALHEADAYEPSADLFARVQRSIEDAAAHRRRVWRWAAGVAVAVAVFALAFAVSVETIQGVARMPVWRMELYETVVLVVLLVVVGPLIRRFGRGYVADVMRSAPDRGGRFLALLDIAFYLVLGAIVLLGIDLAADPAALPPLLAPQLEDASRRIGAFMLVMGTLHALTLFHLPFLGLVLTDAGWRTRRDSLGEDAPPPGRDVMGIDRVAGWITWVLAAAAAVGVAASVAAILAFGVSS